MRWGWPSRFRRTSSTSMPRPRYAARSGDYWPGEKGLAILAMLGRKTERRAPQALPRQPNRERTPKVATRRPPGRLGVPGDAVRLEPSAAGRADGSGKIRQAVLTTPDPFLCLQEVETLEPGLL